MSTMKCQNCDVSYGPDDMFCENCGYDFITGSLPADADGVAAVGTPPVAPSVLDPDGGIALASPGPSSSGGPASGSGSGSGAAAAVAGGVGTAPDSGSVPPLGDVPRLKLTIEADREFFDEMVNDGEIDFPDPLPPTQELELAGAELHIGRTSDGRAIHPDIDVADLTGDQAVSSRHAVLRVANDGTFTIVDVGSTNGTFLKSVDSEAISHGVPVTVEAGVPIYVGAWTKLVIVA